MLPTLAYISNVPRGVAEFAVIPSNGRLVTPGWPILDQTLCHPIRDESPYKSYATPPDEATPDRDNIPVFIY